jgi:hypothetical protein
MLKTEINEQLFQKNPTEAGSKIAGLIQQLGQHSF